MNLRSARRREGLHPSRRPRDHRHRMGVARRRRRDGGGHGRADRGRDRQPEVRAGAGRNRGTFLSGLSPDGSQALGLLTFTQGNAASSILFSGPANDPADAALATELGQAQDALIKNRMGG